MDLNDRRNQRILERRPWEDRTTQCILCTPGHLCSVHARAAVVPFRQREGDQPLPVPNGEVHIQDLVIYDIEQRKALGIRRYGTALQPFNGRDALRDAYEELLDHLVYMRQILYERDQARMRPAPESDDWLFTDPQGNVWRLTPTHEPAIGMPLRFTLVSRA